MMAMVLTWLTGFGRCERESDQLERVSDAPSGSAERWSHHDPRR
jgi:hypothetical protein